MELQALEYWFILENYTVLCSSCSNILRRRNILKYIWNSRRGQKKNKTKKKPTQNNNKKSPTNSFFGEFPFFPPVNWKPWTNGFRVFWCNCYVVSYWLTSAWGSHVISSCSSSILLRATTCLVPVFLIVQLLSAVPRICSRLIPSDNRSRKIIPLGTLKSFLLLLSKSNQLLVLLIKCSRNIFSLWLQLI